MEFTKVFQYKSLESRQKRDHIKLFIGVKSRIHKLANTLSFILMFTLLNSSIPGNFGHTTPPEIWTDTEILSIQKSSIT